MTHNVIFSSVQSYGTASASSNTPVPSSSSNVRHPVPLLRLYDHLSPKASSQSSSSSSGQSYLFESLIVQKVQEAMNSSPILSKAIDKGQITRSGLIRTICVAFKKTNHNFFKGEEGHTTTLPPVITFLKREEFLQEGKDFRVFKAIQMRFNMQTGQSSVKERALRLLKHPNAKMERGIDNEIAMLQTLNPDGSTPGIQKPMIKVRLYGDLVIQIGTLGKLYLCNFTAIRQELPQFFSCPMETQAKAYRELILGLDALHKVGIHRDIKVPNILATKKGKFVLSDFFGAQTFSRIDHFFKRKKNDPISRYTPEYIYFEDAARMEELKERGKHVGKYIDLMQAADIWSLAVALCEAITENQFSTTKGDFADPTVDDVWFCNEQLKDRFPIQKRAILSMLELDWHVRPTISEVLKIWDQDSINH